MKLLWQHKPAVFHGTKVGAATVICAGYYDKLRQISRSEAIKQLDKAQQPTREQYEREIAQAYPGIEDKVLAEQESFISLSAQQYQALKQKIGDRWDDIQAIAASVPPAQQMAEWLKQVGGVTELEALGFTPAEIKEATGYSHLLRNRFNVDKLSHLCGINLK